MLAPGTCIDHRYELVCPVGEGGMAQVWTARLRGKHGFERVFALKVIHPRFADDPRFRAMFLDEARIAAAIQHPNVAQVVDLGEADDMLYLVMEYVDGESVGGILAHMAKTHETAPLDVALRITRDVCAGLHAAHELTDAQGAPRGVIHRDVSPHNILLSVHGEVKLIDFGIALARDRLAGDTNDGSVKGKILYMPPEQARRKPLGPSADVFGAGAVLHALLTGHAPFADDSDAAVLQRLLSGRPATLPDGLPPVVTSVLARALAVAPEDRFPTAGAMAAALDAAMVSVGGQSADLEHWVLAHLSPRARERRATIAARIAPPAAPGPCATPEPVPSLPRAPSEPPAPAAQEFFDVRALARRASQPDAAPPGGSPPAGDDAAGAPLELAVSPRRAPSPPPRPPFPWKAAGGLLVVVLLVAAGVLLVLPGIVRDRIVAAARGAGVELTIDRVSLGWSTVTLRGLTARAPDVPGLVVRCDQVRVHGLDAHDIRVQDVDVTLAGGAFDVRDAIRRLDARVRAVLAPGTPSAPTAPHHVSVTRARVAWSAPFGDGTRLGAGDVALELDAQTRDGRGRPSPVLVAHGSAGNVLFTTARGAALGPWALSFEHTDTMSRARLLLDPALPDGPSLVYFWGPGTAPQLTVRIARSQVTHLGLSPDALVVLGLPADATTEVEAKIDGREAPGGRVEGSGRLDLFGARVRGLRGPVDVRIQGSASGPPGRPLELDKTTIDVGPFTATVTGTIEPHATGARVETAWRVAPVPCERLAKSEAKSMGPFAAALQEVAQATGVVRVTGKAEANGTATFDTAALDQASVQVATRETCGLSIFGW